jgi:hypothetical protein
MTVMKTLHMICKLARIADEEDTAEEFLPVWI